MGGEQNGGSTQSTSLLPAPRGRVVSRSNLLSTMAVKLWPWQNGVSTHNFSTRRIKIHKMSAFYRLKPRDKLITADRAHSPWRNVQTTGNAAYFACFVCAACVVGGAQLKKRKWRTVTFCYLIGFWGKSARIIIVAYAINDLAKPKGSVAQMLLFARSLCPGAV